MFTSGYLRGCRSGINLVPDRADSSPIDEIRESFVFRKDEISSGRIEGGDGLPVSELDYGAENEGMVPIGKDVDNNKLGNSVRVRLN